MGRTNFPDGVNVGNAASGTAEFTLGGTAVTATATELNYVDGIGGAALSAPTAGKIVTAGTIIVPSGAAGTAFIPSGLSTVTAIVASPYGPLNLGTAFVSVDTSVAGGTATLRGYGQNEGGTLIASSASGTASYIAYGA